MLKVLRATVNTSFWSQRPTRASKHPSPRTNVALEVADRVKVRTVTNVDGLKFWHFETRTIRRSQLRVSMSLRGLESRSLGWARCDNRFVTHDCSFRVCF